MQTLSLHEAARLVRLHPETLRAWAKSGRAPGAKLGKVWRFIEEDLIDWIRTNYSPYTPPPSRPAPLTKTQIEGILRRHRVRPGSTTDKELDALLAVPTKRKRRL